MSDLLTLEGVSLAFGGIVALDDVSLTVPAGEIVGLIGPNGAGKTSLFNVVTRLCPPSRGRVQFQGTDLLRLPPHALAGAGIARTFQNLELFRSMTVLEHVLIGMHSAARLNPLSSALSLPGLRRRERHWREQAMALLDDLGLAALAGRAAAGLPFGTGKRLDLARALASRPRLLLLDEPAGGLNHTEIAELAGLITRLRAQHNLTIMLVEHHMDFVMGISDSVRVLDFGRKIAEGTPAQVRAHPAVIEAYLGTGIDGAA